MRRIAGDGPPFGAGRLRRLRLLRFVLAVFLGVPATPDGLPVDFALAPANEPEREVAQAMFARQPLRHGQVLVTDKGFASAEFEALVASMGATLVRPDRKNEQPRFGNLGGVRQWVEAIIATLKGQLDLEGIYTKLGSNRLLPPLIAANAPPAPLELRRALRVIDHSIDDAIHRARMKVAA